MLQEGRMVKIGFALALVLTIVIIGVHSASSSSAQVASGSVSKVVYLQGAQSFVMSGDSFYSDAASSGDKALPYFLNHGWKVRSVHVANSAEKNEAVGYVVIEQ